MISFGAAKELMDKMIIIEIIVRIFLMKTIISQKKVPDEVLPKDTGVPSPGLI